MQIRLCEYLGAVLLSHGMLVGSCGYSASHQPVPVSPSPTLAAKGSENFPTERSGPRTIEAGKSVGPLRLGDTRQRAIELFGKTEEDYNFENLGHDCERSELHWYDVDQDRNGVFVYLKNGRIYQIVAATPRYATSEGLKSGSSPEQVRRYYQHIESYVLRGSGAPVVGGRDIVYWVDRDHGIAFEFYYDSKANKRDLEGVIIFEPGTNFFPEGCISPPQTWVKLAPFALEPSSQQRSKSQ